MRKITVVLVALVGMAGPAALAWRRSTAEAARQSVPPAVAVSEHTELPLSELLGPSSVLAPSERARSLVGKRVKMTGFMAQLELPAKGGFYLVAEPVHCDEAGGGTADLPLNSVFVRVRSLAGQPMKTLPGALEVTGIFELGRAEDEDGRVSWFQVVLDAPAPSLASANTPS